MTQGALGSIAPPPAWEWGSLGYVAERSRECGTPHLQPLSVFLGVGVVQRAEREDNHNQLGADLGKYLTVGPGDIVFNKLRTWQGGLGVSQYTGIVSPAYYVLRPGPRIVPRFVHYLLQSAPYLAELTRLSKWMPPSQFDIPWEALKRLPALLPPLDEQRRIADFLDDQVTRIDQAIELREQQAGLLTEWLDSLRNETLVTRGEVVFTPLNRLVDPHRPITYGIVQAGEEHPGGVPYIKTGDMLNFVPARLSRCSPEIERMFARSRVRPGDLVVAMRASIGALICVPDALPIANLTQGTARIAPAGHITRSWLVHVLQTHFVQEQMQMRAVGSTFRTLNLWDLARVLVPTPPTKVMPKLAAEVEQAHDHVLQAQEAERLARHLLQERKRALITAAVTGEFDVSASSWPVGVRL